MLSEAFVRMNFLLENCLGYVEASCPETVLKKAFEDSPMCNLVYLPSFILEGFEFAEMNFLPSLAKQNDS